MSSKKSWDDLVFGAIEKLAAAPSKLKDPKESVSQAIDWIKTVRSEIQSKIAEEIPSRLSQLDWDLMAEKVADHVVKNYDISVEMKLKFKPKRQAKANEGEHEEEV